MNDYQKSFIASEKVKDLNAYVERLAEVRKIAEELEKEENGDKTEGTENGDKVEGSEGTDETDGAQATEQ